MRFILGYDLNRFTCFSAQKHASIFSYRPVTEHRFSSWLFKFSPPEYPVCSDWSAHTRLTQNREHGDIGLMSWSQGIKRQDY